MICIVSDTHDNTLSTAKALEYIHSLKPELVIHCGDICSPEILCMFEDVPLRAVFGNNDFDEQALQAAARVCGFPRLMHELTLEHAGKQLAVYHGTRHRHVQHLAESQQFDYVFHGHTHIARDERLGRTRIINPGALYRAAKYSIASLNPNTDVLEFHDIPKDGKPS